MSTDGASHELDETRIVLEETNKVYEETNNAGDALLDPETGEPFPPIFNHPLTIPEAAEQARLRRQVQQAMWAKLENRS
jgi:hypothetical protein